MKNFLEKSFWQIKIFNNIFWDYLIFLFLFLTISFFFIILKKIISKQVINKIKNKERAYFFKLIIEKVSNYFLFFTAFYISFFYLNVTEKIQSFLTAIFIIFSSYIILLISFSFIDIFFKEYLKKHTKENKKGVVKNLGLFAKVILSLFLFIFVLSVLRVNVTTLVAGMGVGGIAIAFALQNILSDLFSSFSIYFDKPFVEGDFIVVGDKWGTVESIGIKSTRVRALQGEEIIFSNKELTSVQVRNLAKLKERRVELKLKITYTTPTLKMEKIPKIIEEIIKKEELASFDRAHFNSFGDFSLDYQIVYYVKSPEYIDFMNVNEIILLNIKRRFEKEKIDFAYPTETIYLSSQK